MIQAKFRMLSVNGNISSLSLVGSDGLQSVDIPDLRRSEVYTYQGPKVLQFVETAELVEDQPLPAAVLQISDITQHENALILVFRSETASGVRFRSVLMSDDLSSFPGGSSRFVNITPYSLVLLFNEGSEPIKLASGKVYSHAFKSENQNVHIRIASYAEGQVHKGLDDRIYPKEIHRDIYFIFSKDEGGTGRVKMRRLREHRNAAIRMYQSDD